MLYLLVTAANYDPDARLSIMGNFKNCNYYFNHFKFKHMKKLCCNPLLFLVAIFVFTSCNNPSTTTATTTTGNSADSASKANIDKTKAVYKAIESGDLSKLGDIID